MADPTLDRIPKYDDTRAAQLCYIGTSLRIRFQRWGELSEIEYAVMMTHLAVELTPAKHPSQPWRLFELGAALGTRLRRLGEITDIEESITVFRRVEELTPLGHPNKVLLVNNLGLALLDRFRHLGKVDDLEHSVAVFRSAVKLTPEEHPEQAARLHNLGISLLNRFQHLGELDDLEHSITVKQRSVELTPEGHPEKAGRLDTLGVSLLDRFQHLGELDDLERAITVKQRAVELTPEGHPNKAGRLQNLGASLLDRFRHLGQLVDLERSITVRQRAVELTPEGHPEKAVRLQSLGVSLFDRFRHLGELVDLEHSITVFQHALELTPEGHPERARQLQNLGGSLLDRFEHLGELKDLEHSITVRRRAVELTPEGHPEKAVRLQSLGVSLFYRFRHLGELVDLEHSITVFQRALELTPEGHPHKALRLISLGISLRDKFVREPSQTHFDAALNCLMSAAVRFSSMPSLRWDSANKCALLLRDNLEFGSAEVLLLAHAHAMEVLPEIVWLGHSISRRYQECKKYSSTISSLISEAIHFNALPQAVEWLEAGRTFVWSQILSLSMPLDALKEQHPDLAGRFEEVSKILRRSKYSLEPSSTAVISSLGSAVDVADQYRQQVIRYDQILNEIRRCPGFQDFLRPPKFSSLLPVLDHTDGPVVFISIHASTCNAIVFCQDSSILCIALPNLTEQRANLLRSTWTQNLQRCHVRVRRAVLGPDETFARGEMNMLRRVLSRLYTWVAQPILRRLKLFKRSSVGLPHITWCPTGPLTQLPLHAAGIYDVSKRYRPHVFDFVVSSYTPSLSVLLQHGRKASSTLLSQQSLLMVAQPATPGLSPLRGTKAECARIRAALPHTECTLLEHDQALVQHTRAVLDQYSWVHLACHGKQDTTDPTQSAFALYDGPLTLSMLMTTVSDNAELAFLSACQTAVGDEKIPEESAHLAAGMMVVGFKGVIATMWSIGDEDAPIVAEAYYKKLIELRSSGAYGKGGATGAAYALHEAVRVLREKVGEDNIVKWAPFVHFGV